MRPVSCNNRSPSKVRRDRQPNMVPAMVGCWGPPRYPLRGCIDAARSAFGFGHIETPRQAALERSRAVAQVELTSGFWPRSCIFPHRLPPRRLSENRTPTTVKRGGRLMPPRHEIVTVRWSSRSSPQCPGWVSSPVYFPVGESGEVFIGRPERDGRKRSPGFFPPKRPFRSAVTVTRLKCRFSPLPNSRTPLLFRSPIYVSPG